MRPSGDRKPSGSYVGRLRQKQELLLIADALLIQLYDQRCRGFRFFAIALGIALEEEGVEGALAKLKLCRRQRIGSGLQGFPDHCVLFSIKTIRHGMSAAENRRH